VLLEFGFGAAEVQALLDAGAGVQHPGGSAEA